MIRLEHVTKSFGPLRVLDDVCLEIATGEVVVVIGPSGAGKSTLLRIINHLEPADSGTVFIEGQPVYRYEQAGRIIHDPERPIREIRAQVGMVFQHFAVKEPAGSRSSTLSGLRSRSCQTRKSSMRGWRTRPTSGSRGEKRTRPAGSPTT